MPIQLGWELFNQITGINALNNNKKGKPFVVLQGKTKTIVQRTIKKRYKTFLTISDEQKYALAVVIITYI